MLRVFSTFSGVGGLDYPFHQDPRFEVVGHCENDRFASAVLEFHFPKTPNFGDITKVDLAELPSFDVLVGGFPCTDISFQGKQAGFKGKKSSLFKMLVPLIAARRPKFVLLENVEALLSEKFAWEFSYVKTELEKAGYRVSYDVFDSSDYGVPQQRRRVFILGTRQDVAEYEGHSIHAQFGLYEVEVEKRNVEKPKNMVSWSRSTREHHIDHRIRTDGLANTCTTGKGCNGFSTGNFIVDGLGLRIPTPIECEQLMGWERDWTKFGIKVDKKGRRGVFAISDTQRFRMIGNGVVSACVYPMLELMVKVNEKNEAKVVA